MKLLTVIVDRLRQWYRPGLLCIGNSAHAMSPIGGVGINLAMQDAVAAANILAQPLRRGTPTLEELRKVQGRREWPARVTQRLQLTVQNQIMSRVLRLTREPKDSIRAEASRSFRASAPHSRESHRTWGPRRTCPDCGKGIRERVKPERKSFPTHADLNGGIAGTGDAGVAFPTRLAARGGSLTRSIVQEVMMTKRFTLTVAAVALAAAASVSLPAQAADGVKIGVLTCAEQEGWGYIIGGSQRLNCRFDPNSGAPSEWYTGHVSKLGLDIGHVNGGTITWAVFAPASNLDPGALQGTYGGLTASVALGAGIGANAMIGGFDRAIQLQPLSVEGVRGTELAAGLGSIDLKFMGVG